MRTTEPFDRLLAMTQPDMKRHILDNPIFPLLASGKLTKDHYVRYVVETFHLVSHTSRALALAASRVTGDRDGLRSWLLAQATEESGHDKFCFRDLKALGADVAALHGEPGPGAWGMITQINYLAGHRDPVGVLGVASATEQLGAEIAGESSREIGAQLGIPSKARTFLTSHSGFDVRHLEEAKKAINEFVTDDAMLHLVAHARRNTFRYYGQLFLDVLGTDKKPIEELAA